METVTISLEKYEKLIEAEKKLLSWYVSLDEEIRSLRFVWNDLNLIKELFLNKTEKKRIDKIKIDKEYIKKETEQVYKKLDEIYQKELRLDELQKTLDEKEEKIDSKWKENLAFKIGFFILVFIIFLLVKWNSLTL